MYIRDLTKEQREEVHNFIQEKRNGECKGWDERDILALHPLFQQDELEAELCDATNQSATCQVKEIIKKGAKDFNTPLLYCSAKNVEFGKMKLLVKAGATNLDEALFEIALNGCEPRKARYLVKHGAKVDMREVYKAIYKGKTKYRDKDFSENGHNRVLGYLDKKFPITEDENE